MKPKEIGLKRISEIYEAEKTKIKDEPWIVQTEYGQYKIMAYEIEPVIRLEGNGERVAIAHNANHFVVATFTKVIYYVRLSNFKSRLEATEARQRHYDKKSNIRRDKDTRLYTCGVHIFDRFSRCVYVWRVLVG